MPDEQAFRAFAAARAPALLRTAYLLTTDRAQAEDLLQTTLTKVYVGWGRRRDPQAAEAYARRTMVPAHASWWRRRSAQERPSPDGEVHPTGEATDAYLGVLERDNVWTALRTLPRQQQVVVVLRHYEDLPIAAAANVMGISPGSVKTHTSRALASLRLRLNNPESEPARDGGVS